MNTEYDKRLIEDCLPIMDISLEAAGEPSMQKGHIANVHLGRGVVGSHQQAGHEPPALASTHGVCACPGPASPITSHRHS